MKLIIDIDEDVRIAISRMGLLRIPDEMQKKVDKAIQRGTPLDKIRAEIDQNAYPIVHGVNNHEKGMTLYGILQIIDKYKADSEPQESEE